MTVNILFYKCLHTRNTLFQMKLQCESRREWNQDTNLLFPMQFFKNFYVICIRLNETWRFQKYFEFFIFMKKVDPSSKKL